MVESASGFVSPTNRRTDRNETVISRKVPKMTESDTKTTKTSQFPHNHLGPNRSWAPVQNTLKISPATLFDEKIAEPPPKYFIFSPAALFGEKITDPPLSKITQWRCFLPKNHRFPPKYPIFSPAALSPSTKIQLAALICTLQN